MRSALVVSIRRLVLKATNIALQDHPNLMSPGDLLEHKIIQLDFEASGRKRKNTTTAY